jgi:hypothetical protein
VPLGETGSRPSACHRRSDQGRLTRPSTIKSAHSAGSKGRAAGTPSRSKERDVDHLGVPGPALLGWAGGFSGLKAERHSDRQNGRAACALARVMVQTAGKKRRCSPYGSSRKRWSRWSVTFRRWLTSWLQPRSMLAIRTSASLKVFRRGPQHDGRHLVVAVHVDKPRKDEAAGARRCLWGKSADDGLHVAHKRQLGFRSPRESLPFFAKRQHFEPRNRAMVDGIRRTVPLRANKDHAGPKLIPAADQAKG